jgi:hypothetical protein
MTLSGLFLFSIYCTIAVGGLGDVGDIVMLQLDHYLPASKAVSSA